MDITKKGQSILSYLQSNTDKHMTAEEIAAHFKTTDSPISTATVYRSLEKLTAAGRVRKYITSPEEPACYQFAAPDSACVRHFHLKCTACGRLFHVSCPYLDKLEEHIGSHHGFEVDNTRTVLYGLCKGCRESTAENASNKGAMQ